MQSQVVRGAGKLVQGLNTGWIAAASELHTPRWFATEVSGPENTAPTPVDPQKAAFRSLNDWPLEDKDSNNKRGDTSGEAHAQSNGAASFSTYATPMSNMGGGNMSDVQMAAAAVANNAAQAAAAAAEAAARMAKAVGSATSINAAELNAAADHAAMSADNASTLAMQVQQAVGSPAQPDMSAYQAAAMSMGHGSPMSHAFPASAGGSEVEGGHYDQRGSNNSHSRVAHAGSEAAGYPNGRAAEVHRDVVGHPLRERSFVDKVDPVAPDQVRDEDERSAKVKAEDTAEGDAAYLASS